MDSAKSMNLLAVAHNYRKQGKRVVLMKPRLDTRFGVGVISSRSGLEAEADFMVDADTQLDPAVMRKFGLFSCGSRQGKPYLNYEILWTPVLRARLESHAWLADLDWPHFIDTAVDGEVFDGKGIIVIVKLHETEDDHRQD